MTCVLCKGKKFQILFPHHNDWKMGKCVVCGLVQVVPMPSSTEISSLYHEDFDHFTPYIEQLSVHHAYFRQKINEIGFRIKDVRFKNKEKSKRTIHPTSYLLNFKLLDIGCAMGVLLEEAKDRGIKAVGIDLSKDAVSYCRKHGLAAFYGTIQSLSSRPGLERGGYDIVTAFQVIEHERDPLDMMRRIYALLKPGGVAVIATPNVGGFWARIMGRRWVGFTHPEHVVLFDHATMRRLVESAGFRKVEVKNDTPRPFPLSFAITRAGDYFPWLSWLLKPIGLFFDRFDIHNPVNPWDDMIVFARK